MKFQICEKGEPTFDEKNVIHLYRDNWDDYTYKTSFKIYYRDNSGISRSIGYIKIGAKNMTNGKVFELLPKQFQQLPDTFFSLGQDETYYANIAQLGDANRREILLALRDVAYDLNHFKACKNERVMQVSLLRSVTEFSVEHQLNRMAHGGAQLTNYEFSYSISNTLMNEDFASSQISFDVVPDSNPPTNVHVLIGRNGTGKTSLLKNMIYSIRCDDASRGKFGYLAKDKLSKVTQFANVLCIAFSPFDDFSDMDLIESSIPYSYIGLNKQSGDLLQTIENQFITAFTECMVNARKRRLWMESIDILKSDPTFAEEQIDSLATSVPLYLRDGLLLDGKERIKHVFSKLSSGHKVVLLTITCCVEKIEEKSIVFMDEPENHLHPPLLAALVRALSKLLIDRNGVAIISTHSPVVLQEVPSSCVWKLRRYDQQLVAERLPAQTFGASIGSLTNEIFGLEVTNSGFHKLLAEAVDNMNDYEMIVNEFGGQLGNEATILLRTLLALRNKEGQ